MTQQSPVKVKAETLLTQTDIKGTSQLGDLTRWSFVNWKHLVVFRLFYQKYLSEGKRSGLAVRLKPLSEHETESKNFPTKAFLKKTRQRLSLTFGEIH